MKEYVVFYPDVRCGKDPVIGEFVIIGKPPQGKESQGLKTSIGDNAVIRSHTVIYAGNIIGSNFQTGHGVLIRENNEIGDNVSIGSGSVIEHHTKVENGVRIHSQVFVPEYSVLEENCWLGPNVVLTNAKYPLSPNVKKELRGVIIRKGAKIGANSTMLPGVVIGENALVGAGSVVTKNVQANKVVAGNPAIIINEISELPYTEIEKTE